ncbi:hypothetical protein ACQPZ2_44230 (plasmid) [Nocardia pseudovaccinii]|uniref:hypothetical protein n=1 Tax=Nocardia pseudovaccinii TaxID=189540 RepID=UPI003D91825C
MNRNDDSKNPEEPDLVARTRALLDRSSLGEEGPRLLRERTARERVDRIRDLLAHRQAQTDFPISPAFDCVPIDISARLASAGTKTYQITTPSGVGPMAPARKPCRRDVDLVIRSEPIRLEPPRKTTIDHHSTYMVLVYGRLGTYAIIATPANRVFDGQHRISTIFATTNRSYKCKEPDLFQTVARTVLSDCFQRQSPLTDILDLLAASFRPTSIENQFSQQSIHNTSGKVAAVIAHFQSLVRQRLREAEEYKPKVRFKDQSCTNSISMPKTSEDSRCDIENPEDVEALVIAANEHEVGFSADLRNKPFGSLHDAVQKMEPTKFKNTSTPDFQKELEQTITLTKPGGKFAKSWDGEIDNTEVQNIVRVFSNVIKNISWMPPEVGNQIDGVIDVHLQELDSEFDVGQTIETTWTSTPMKKEREHETSAAGDCSLF